MTNPMQFPDGFVFGGATAAYQVEGETRTHGKAKCPGTISWLLRVASPPIPRATSTTSTRSISTCASVSASTVSASPSLGAASSPTALARSTPRASLLSRAFRHLQQSWRYPLCHARSLRYARAFYQNGGEGFLTRTTIDAFVEYAKFCFAEFTEVKHWFTFNEIPATAEGSFIVGNWPHGEKYRLDKAFQLMHNMMVAHAKAVVAFHEGGFEGEIGIVQNLEPKYPLDPTVLPTARQLAWPMSSTTAGCSTPLSAATMQPTPWKPQPSWPISPAASSTSATRTSPR